ncbi:MAG TPA: YHS domain-containing protein [Nitrososphaera sp.]|nr:YHS domain-containing protein [Nitrososphaera sp.]HKI06802.1 YHS domain-containing protein [Nitrososphaeraceae archaeon]
MTCLDLFIYDISLIRLAMFKDPVCKMMVDEKTAKHLSEVGGKKVYLCSAACKSQFDANPKKYGY